MTREEPADSLQHFLLAAAAYEEAGTEMTDPKQIEELHLAVNLSFTAIATEQSGKIRRRN